MSATRAVACGLVGCGTVGSGVVRLWEAEGQAPPARLAAVAVRDAGKRRGADLSRVRLTTDAFAVVRDPAIDVVLEATSDPELAHALALEALDQGKAFVTASKALVARHGAALEHLAARRGGAFRFEAAAGGAVPVVALLRLGLSPGRVHGLEGVLNGTCNFVLSQLAEGLSFRTALDAARRAGFAEADSRQDTSGADTALKLAILARLCGFAVDPAAIPTEGIERLDHADVAYGRARGWSLKLVASLRPTALGVVAAVRPCFVPAASLLGVARAEENAVLLDSGATGQVGLLGPGAGSLPTAAAMLADVREVLDRRSGRATPPARAATVVPDEAEERHYLRVKVPFGERSASRETVQALRAAGVGTEAVACDRPGGVQVLTAPATAGQVRRALETLRADERVHVVVRDPAAARTPNVWNIAPVPNVSVDGGDAFPVQRSRDDAAADVLSV